MNKQTRNELISMTTGLVGIAAAAVLQVPLVITGLAGIGLYAGTKLLLPYRAGVVLSDSLPAEVKLEVEKINSIMADISDRIQKMGNSDITSKIHKILALGQKVVIVLTDDDSDYTFVKDVTKLFGHLQLLLNKYISLSGHTVEYDDLDKAKKSFDELLDKIYASLNQYYKKGIKSDLQDFDIDMKIVETTIDTLKR